MGKLGCNHHGLGSPKDIPLKVTTVFLSGASWRREKRWPFAETKEYPLEMLRLLSTFHHGNNCERRGNKPFVVVTAGSKQEKMPEF